MLIHLCRNEGFCTADCTFKPTCRKQRIPLLIHAVVVDYQENEIYSDEYLNEIALLKQQLVDQARHMSGRQINVLDNTKIELTTV